MCNGQVVLKSYDADGYGNYIIMKDSITGMGFLYAHLKEPSIKEVGDYVSIGEFVGIEGTTGSSTGIHLHLEMQDISNHSWQFGAPKEVYTNPATFLGIPNEQGITAIYYGEPYYPVKKKKFPWVLYANRLRNRYLYKEQNFICSFFMFTIDKLTIMCYLLIIVLLERRIYMEDIVNLLTNNGIGIVCVAYLIYFQSTTMKSMLNTLGTINERLSIIENKIDGKGDL